MKQENRHQAILYAVMRQGYVSIESLAEELGVSSQTIRRDISELDRTGMLERRPGGASCRTTILNSTYDARQVEDFKDKERIARTIAEYIPDNSSIFLTLGTTVEVIAYALLERSGLMVITNNVVAALTLNKKTDFEVVLASGYMRKSSNGLVGESTIEFVNGFQCDYVITSTGGISEADGHLLDYHTADVSVAQCMMQCKQSVACGKPFEDRAAGRGQGSPAQDRGRIIHQQPRPFSVGGGRASRGRGIDRLLME